MPFFKILLIFFFCLNLKNKQKNTKNLFHQLKKRIFL